MRNLTVALLVALAACTEPVDADRSSSAIVGGTPVVGSDPLSGWAAVGALTYYNEAFCSGTLIAPHWVLTAGHCVVGGYAAAETSFYIGNVTPGSGTYHDVGFFVPHPSYSSSGPTNDVALVYLTTAVSGVTPIPYNTTNISSGYTGVTVRYVGFGNNTGYDGTGSGTKRWANLDVNWVGAQTYDTDSTSSTGVCAGDSGGPGLYQFGGTWKVMGVNSTVAGSPEPCLNGISTQTRVDVYATWIAGEIGAALSCTTTPDMCECAAACVGGVCNDSLCPTTNCEGIVDCMNPCTTDACANDCYNAGSATAQSQYANLIVCYNDHCASASDTNACLEANCAAEYLACMPPDDCAIAGGSCGTQACYPGFASELYCWDTAGKDPGAACNAAAAGLECDDGYLCIGTACEHMCTGDGDCLAEDHCEKPLFTGIADIGLCVCDDDDADGACSVDDCDDADPLVKPGASERCNGVDDNCDGTIDEGCSACVDNDGDLSCQPDDCDDNNVNVWPGAPEICNSVDDDCDGTADEECSACVDVDADGVCAPTDCNDGDNYVYPGAAELCDTVDNDCDGEVDEGCDGTSDDSGSCGCRAGGAGSSPAGAGLVLLLGLALVSRRRR